MIRKKTCYVHTASCWSVGVYVPVGGKKLLTFMDDFNMPAKDTFGSQPPLELMRQWIDYGFWYDRQKQTVKQIKVRAVGLFAHMHVCLCHTSGYVPVGCHGSAWGRQDDHLQETAEQIQPDQHDLPSSTFVILKSDLAHPVVHLSCTYFLL